MWKCGEKIVFSCPAVGKQKVTFPPNSTHEKLLSVQPCNSLSCCSPIGTLRLKSPALCCEPAIHPSPPLYPPSPRTKRRRQNDKENDIFLNCGVHASRDRPTDRPTNCRQSSTARRGATVPKTLAAGNYWKYLGSASFPANWASHHGLRMDTSYFEP